MDGDISRSRERPSGAADTGVRSNLEPRTELQNNKNWSLQELLVRTSNRTPEPDTAKESSCLMGRVRLGGKIDLEERLVTLRDHKLRSEEFDVLVFLASHPRSLVTPQTMLARTSPANQLGQTKFLTTLISLRKKLDAAGHGKHYLRTDPWIIYRFDPTASSA
jgi:DNA-binding response OmpR family regulator